MYRFQVSQQEAMLGLSLYVFSCESGLSAAGWTSTDEYRWRRPTSLGPLERGERDWEKSYIRHHVHSLLLLQYLSRDCKDLAWLPGFAMPTSILRQPMSR